MDRETALKLMLGLSVVGLLVAFYQTYEHYYLTSAVCDLSATFSCSTVTESVYGEFPPASGIATAAWGVLWWLGALALLGAIWKGMKLFAEQVFYLFAWMVFGTGFVVYLLVVELYLLPQETGQLVICPFCTVQHVLIVLLLGLSYTLLEKPVKQSLTNIFYTEA